MSFKKEQLLPGESLIIETHQHYMVLLRAILVNIAAVVVFAGISIVSQKPWFLAFLLFPLAYLLWEIIVRLSREYILTDHRVVKQEGIFSIKSFDASLDKVNNVFHEQTLLGRLFKYGNVGLETASEQGTTVFYQIPDPVNFKNAVVRQREMYKSLADKHGAASAREDIPRMIQDLASLRDRGIISDAEFAEKRKNLLNKI